MIVQRVIPLAVTRLPEPLYRNFPILKRGDYLWTVKEVRLGSLLKGYSGYDFLPSYAFDISDMRELAKHSGLVDTIFYHPSIVMPGPVSVFSETEKRPTLIPTTNLGDSTLEWLRDRKDLSL